MKPVCQHMDFGVLPGHQFTVEPDPAITLVHWHASHRLSPVPTRLCFFALCPVAAPRLRANRSVFGR
jgi:hypothetical protein